MTTINFPTITPPAAPYDLEYEDVVIRSPMDGPYTITRKRFTRGRVMPMTFTWNLLSHAEYSTLIDFYVNTIKSGSLSFNFKMPVRGESDFTFEVLLQSPPKTRYVGSGFWEVTLVMEEVI